MWGVFASAAESPPGGLLERSGRTISSSWEDRLAHQVHDLLPFKDAYDDGPRAGPACQEAG